MKTEKSEVAIIGAGVHGMGTAYQLAREETSVVVIEQFGALHGKGQSKGSEKQMSFAYGTAQRITLSLQAIAEVRGLEQASEHQIFFQTGGIDLVTDAKEMDTITNNRDAMQSVGVDFEVWDHRKLAKKGWRVREDAVALFSPNDGILCPKRMMKALLRQTQDRGATIRYHEKVVRVSSDGTQVDILTTAGRYRAKKLVIACGAWTNEILHHFGFRLPIYTTREQTDYFIPKANQGLFRLGNFPNWIHHREPAVYGFPTFEERGAKVGFHRAGPPIDINDFDASVRPEATDGLRAYLGQYLPDLNGEAFGSESCVYDNIQGLKPAVGAVPDFPNCFVLAGFSGSGFGPALAIDRGVADLVMRGRTEMEISEFNVSRFAN